MNHNEIQHKLFLFDDPELTKAERGEIERHTAVCAGCAETFVRWQRVRALFPTAAKETEAGRGSADFVCGVMENVLALKQAEWQPAGKRNWFKGWAAQMMGYAFALVLLVTAFVYPGPLVAPDDVLLSDLPAPAQQIVMNESLNVDGVYE